MQYLIAFGKTGVVFVAMWMISRRLGRHMVGRVTLFDFISSITLGSVAAQAMAQGQPLPVLIASAVFWTAFVHLFNWLDIKGRGLHSFLNGDPVVVVENGQIIEENLGRERVSLKQVESLLRQKGYFDVSEVEIAMLETNGKLSVRPRSQHRPLQPADLGVPTKYQALSTQVIHGGRPLRKELAGLGLSEAWLQEQLARQGVPGVEEVFAAWLTSDGRLVVDRVENRPH